jgi:hypothetical protein
MRTSIFAAVLGLSLVGCLVGDEGTPGTTGGGDPSGTGSRSGTGTGSGSGSGMTPTPKLDVSLDKPTISAELLSSSMVTVTLRASGGFSGPVGITATAVDASSAAIPGWTVTLDKTTVNVAADGTATVVATVQIPSDSAAATGTLKVDTTSSLGPASQTAPVNVAKQLTVNLTLNGTNCVYPTAMVGTIKVANGTKIRWVNGDAAANLTVHISAGIGGLNHEQGATPPAGVYEQTVSATSGTTDWYCHNRNDPKNMNLQAVP